jgi:hypothetical protein
VRERLVIGVKRIRLVKDLQVQVKAGSGDAENLVSVATEMPGERATAVQAERDAAMPGADAVIRTCHDSEQVAGDRRGCG